MNYYNVISKIILVFPALLYPKTGFSEPFPQPSIILEDNEINDNHLAGVIVRGDQAVEIRNSRIRSNGEAGVEIDAAAGKDEIRDSFAPPLFRWINAELNTPENSQKLLVKLNNCEIDGNGRGGVDVKQGAEADISESRIHHNELSGIMVSSNGSVFGPSRVSLTYSGVWDNGHAGVRATPRGISIKGTELSKSEPIAEVYISNSRINRNQKAGVMVENASILTLKDSELSENGSGLISRVWPFVPNSPTGKEIHDFEGLTAPDDYVFPLLNIYRNAISFNAGPGIHVIDGVTGSFGISNNQIYNNEQSGIYLGVADDPFLRCNLSVSIINNTITSNGSDQNGAGIRDESRGRVVAANNILAYNHETGIWSEECKEASHNLLFANGLAGNCCSDETSDELKWAERFQRSGALEGCEDIIMDPLFVDPDKYDFRLKRQSPAIDAGSTESVYEEEKFPPSQGTKINDLGASGGPLAAQ